jgi:hypothetical protein
MGLTITDLSISGTSRRVRENFRLAPTYSDLCLILTRDEFDVPPPLRVMARHVWAMTTQGTRVKSSPTGLKGRLTSKGGATSDDRILT